MFPHLYFSWGDTLKRYDKILIILKLLVAIELLLIIILYQIGPIASIIAALVCLITITIVAIVLYHIKD